MRHMGREKLAKVCVSNRCGLCYKKFTDNEKVVILENARLTTQPLPNHPVNAGKIRVLRMPGTRLAWCKDCANMVLQKIFPNQLVS